jgi:hypothetical protein
MIVPVCRCLNVPLCIQLPNSSLAAILRKSRTEFQPPWVNTQIYALDKKTIGEGALEDGFLQLTNPASCT